MYEASTPNSLQPRIRNYMRPETVPPNSRKPYIPNHHLAGPQLSGQIDQAVHVTTEHGTPAMRATNTEVCQRQ